MAYDIYGDLVLIHDSDPLTLVKLLGLGYTRIYERTKCLDTYRNMDARWVSPYKETSLDPYYLCVENKKLFFGNIKTVFYNPRYNTDRVLLEEHLRTYKLDLKTLDLAIVGSGISPYTVYLRPSFAKVTEYEVNEEAVHYGRINKVLNKIQDVKTHSKAYQGEQHDLIISVVPSEDLSFHKKYNFKKLLILYYTCRDSELESTTKQLAESYQCALDFVKIVRPYSKLINTYRIHLRK